MKKQFEHHELLLHTYNVRKYIYSLDPSQVHTQMKKILNKLEMYWIFNYGFKSLDFAIYKCKYIPQ